MYPIKARLGSSCPLIPDISCSYINLFTFLHCLPPQHRCQPQPHVLLQGSLAGAAISREMPAMLVQEAVGVTLPAISLATAAQILMQLVALKGVRMKYSYVTCSSRWELFLMYIVLLHLGECLVIHCHSSYSVWHFANCHCMCYGSTVAI